MIVIDNDNENDNENDSVNLPAVPLPDEFMQAVALGGYIPSIQLVQSGSKVLKEYDPKVHGPVCPEEGMFWFDKDQMLGTYHKETKSGAFVGIPLASQPHALLLVGGNVAKESFNFKSPLYAEIMAMKKQQGGQVRPMWGADILFWIPEISAFGTYFIHSSARDVIAPTMQLKDRFVSIRAEFAKNKMGVWKVPGVYQLAGADFLRPDPELALKMVQKFNARSARDNTAPTVGGGVDR